MTRYGQFCPMAKAAEIVAERWTLLIIRELLAGSTRFNDLRRGVPLMSPALLSQRLQQLEREGVIERQRVTARGTHDYRLTEAGRALAPVVRLLGEWGGHWILDRVDEHDLDVTLLMWAMRRRVDPAAFGSRRVVVAFDFTDLPQAQRYWWLVNNGHEVDLCPKDPGFDVDLHVVTSLPVMTRIWVGALVLNAAVRDGRVEFSGARVLQQQFRSWLLLSPFASAAVRADSLPGGNRARRRSRHGAKPLL
jgi:DNA-binding HxlR family transcriptional regulator